MISLAAAHEAEITRFHRNHYIISISELQNKSSIGYDNHSFNANFSIEAVMTMYPSITIESLARLLLVSIRMKIQEGQMNYLLTYTDETKQESMDLLNGLVHVFQLEPTTKELRDIFEILQIHAGQWTEAMCQAEEKYHNIENTLNILRNHC